MWVELIQQTEFPDSFGESQLCLILKIENIPCPDQFRPISVTNSDYQIVMQYWALWFSEIASGVVGVRPASNMEVVLFSAFSVPLELP